MSISLQSSVGAAITATRSPTFTLPSYTPKAGDVIPLFAGSTGTGWTPTAPSGWVNIFSGTVHIETTAHGMCCFYHIVTVAEELAVTTTFTATNLFGTAQTGDLCACALRGVDQATPMDYNNNQSSSSVVTPHVLASVLGANVFTGSYVTSCVFSDGPNTYTQPAGWTIRASSNVNQGAALLTRDTLTVRGTNIAAVNITPATSDEDISITVVFTHAPELVWTGRMSQAVVRAGFY